MYLKIFLFFTGVLLLVHCRTHPTPNPLSGDATIQLLTEAIEEMPFEDSLYFLRAQYYYDQGVYDLSVQDLNYAIQLDSLQPLYYHLLADAYLDHQQSYEALNVMMRASLRFPNRIATLLKLCEFQHILKQYEASLKTVQRIQAIDPLNAESYFMAGLNYRDLKDTGQAIIKLQFTTNLDDRHTDAWIVLGQLMQYQNPNLALSYFENAVRIDSTHIPALHSLAGFLQDRGEYTRALDMYDKIIGLDPTYPDAFVHTGMIYFNMDSFSRALNAFEILCQLQPTHADYPYYRGNAKEALGDLAGARDDYNLALRLDPLHKGAREALAQLK